jgi:hypothetical protein
MMKISMPKRFIVASAALLASSHLSAQISSVKGPIAADERNQIYGAADAPGAKAGINLKDYGYVEEEYFLEGRAAAYEHSPEGLRARTDKLPYTTRIIVRRPADGTKFSGVIHFEPVHPTHGWNGQWLVLNRYLMSRGDIYVFAGVGDASKGWSGSPTFKPPAGPTGQNRILKWFNPKRYAAINWPGEEGIRYEVMADIGQKLRSKDDDNPLKALDVKAILVGGWSYTGSIQRTFINEGFHDRARLPNGKPVFDGYLVGVSSSWNDPGYLPLYNDEPFVPLDSPRRRPKKTDARVIEFLTESEVELAKGHVEAPDSDEAIGGHRVYELAAVIHTDNLMEPHVAREGLTYQTQLRNKGYKFSSVSTVSIKDCALPESDIPQHAFVRAAVENLRHWVLDGATPPRGQRLVKEGAVLTRDAVGNVLGGIRAAEFEAPLARYDRYHGTDMPGCRADNLYPSVFLVRQELSKEKLTDLYGSPERYMALYESEIGKLVAQRWLLPEDGDRLKAITRERLANGF